MLQIEAYLHWASRTDVAIDGASRQASVVREGVVVHLLCDADTDVDECTQSAVD
jgi:hypothetical protein